MALWPPCGAGIDYRPGPWAEWGHIWGGRLCERLWLRKPNGTGTPCSRGFPALLTLHQKPNLLALGGCRGRGPGRDASPAVPGVSWAVQLLSWAPWLGPGRLLAVLMVSWCGLGPWWAPGAPWPVMAAGDPGPWPVILAVILADRVPWGSCSERVWCQLGRAAAVLGLLAKCPTWAQVEFLVIFPNGEFFLHPKPYEVGPWRWALAVGCALMRVCAPVRA